MNVFENYQLEKENLRKLCRQAAAYGWVSAENQKEIEQKLDNEVLTLGVIGQMKAGKSTFLNAFVFERDVLPAATTPMTAALTIITYGEEEKIEAEFYNEAEWNEQCLTAQRNLAEITNELERSKVQAAQELIDKSDRLGGKLKELLGRKQSDSLDKLIEYVGADGRFISITKSVRIYYPKDYLKGVEIVDTPGFNDPIVSREKRTRDFLGKADVVLMMLYAGRPFDATDREIIFKHLSSCGIGKLVIGINKYDIPFENGETEEEIKEYVIDEIRKASQGMKDDSLKELLREATPIPFSAEMALLSYLPMNSINTNERYKYAWERYCDNFEIGTQIDFRNKSLLSDLSECILDIIMKEKAAILFAKPRNSIKAAIQNFRLKIELEIKAVKDNITNMSLLDDDLDKKQTNLNKAKKRLEKKTDNYLYELREGLCELTGEYSDKITHIVSGLCEDAQRAIDNFGSTETADIMKQKVDEILSPLTARIIRQEIKRLKGQRKKTSIRITEDYTDEVSTLLSRFFEDIDTSDVLLELKRICDIEQIDESVREDIGELLSEFKHRSHKRIWFSNSKTKVDIKDSILKYQENFDIDERLKKIMDIENLEPRIKELMFENFLIPLQNNLKEVVQNKEKRQQMLSDAQTKLERLKLQQEDLNKKIATIIL